MPEPESMLSLFRELAGEAPAPVEITAPAPAPQLLSPEEKAGQIMGDYAQLARNLVAELNEIPEVQNQKIKFGAITNPAWTGNVEYENSEDGLGHVDYGTVTFTCAKAGQEPRDILTFDIVDRLRIEAKNTYIVPGLGYVSYGLRPLDDAKDLEKLKLTLAKAARAAIYGVESVIKSTLQPG